MTKAQNPLKQRRRERARECQTGDESRRPRPTGESNELVLTSAESAVLSVFREYLMTPGKMLCFAHSDLEAFNLPLSHLLERGFLVAETFKGGYSLTDIGYLAMRRAKRG